MSSKISKLYIGIRILFKEEELDGIIRRVSCCDYFLPLPVLKKNNIEHKGGTSQFRNLSDSCHILGYNFHSSQRRIFPKKQRKENRILLSNMVQTIANNIEKGGKKETMRSEQVAQYFCLQIDSPSCISFQQVREELQGRSSSVFSIWAKGQETPAAAILCLSTMQSGQSSFRHQHCSNYWHDKSSGNILKTKYSVSCLNIMSSLQEKELQRLQAARLRANQRILVMI